MILFTPTEGNKVAHALIIHAEPINRDMVGGESMESKQTIRTCCLALSISSICLMLCFISISLLLCYSIKKNYTYILNCKLNDNLRTSSKFLGEMNLNDGISYSFCTMLYYSATSIVVVYR